MTGYVQKDEGRSWYQFDSVGLTQDFCGVALANYRRKAAGVLKDNAKIQINKKSFWPVMINLSQKEYFPLKMSGAQLTLYAIQSGEYGPCYSWISSTSSQGIPVEKAVSFWRCWTAHAEVHKQDVFFDTRKSGTWPTPPTTTWPLPRHSCSPRDSATFCLLSPTPSVSTFRVKRIACRSETFTRPFAKALSFGTSVASATVAMRKAPSPKATMLCSFFL
ncbi:unnamed protein product [Ectocarpus fasciculatus]